MNSAWGYLIVWEFHVRHGQEKTFERVYGSGGEWARLFRRSEQYLGTELIRDAQNPDRYVTLDFWSTRDAYAQFRTQHLVDYEKLDARCEELTETEAVIGTFERVVGPTGG
jgi:heme-degrading monooxygenase HmoA